MEILSEGIPECDGKEIKDGEILLGRKSLTGNTASPSPGVPGGGQKTSFRLEHSGPWKTPVAGEIKGGVSWGANGLEK